jgi:hypothetical protein
VSPQLLILCNHSIREVVLCICLDSIVALNYRRSLLQVALEVVTHLSIDEVGVVIVGLHHVFLKQCLPIFNLP